MWDDPGLVDVLRIEALLDALAGQSRRPAAARQRRSSARWPQRSARRSRASRATTAPTAQAEALRRRLDGAGRRGCAPRSSRRSTELERARRRLRARPRARSSPPTCRSASPRRRADVAELGSCAGRARQGRAAAGRPRGIGARCGRGALRSVARRGESGRGTRRRSRRPCTAAWPTTLRRRPRV